MTTSHTTTSSPGRRGFLGQTLAVLLAAGALVPPAAAALIAYLNPLRQRSTGGRFYRVTNLAALP
ncbi:MAG: hypothetical protein ACOC46_00385, partial [Pirellulales bacterium]